MRYEIQLRVERGGQAPRFKGQEARKRVRRELHQMVLDVQGADTVAAVAACAPAGTPLKVAHWWTDLRAQNNWAYGSLLRFIDIAVARRTPRARLLVIADLIAAYITEVTEEYEYTPPNRPPVMRRVA